MNIISRTITGMIMVIGGLILIVLGFNSWAALFYGILILLLGFFILFNKKEDKIERRKDQ